MEDEKLHFEKLKNMYLKANVNTQIFDTTQITISKNRAEIRLEVTDKYFHALGAMHGAVYFKMLDDAAFFAVNSIIEDVFVLTTSFTIKLKRPASEGQIHAIGVLNSQSENSYTATSTLYDSSGREIGSGTGTFVKSKVKLSPEIGYK